MTTPHPEGPKGLDMEELVERVCTATGCTCSACRQQASVTISALTPSNLKSLIERDGQWRVVAVEKEDKHKLIDDTTLYGCPQCRSINYVAHEDAPGRWHTSCLDCGHNGPNAPSKDAAFSYGGRMRLQEPT